MSRPAETGTVTLRVRPCPRSSAWTRVPKFRGDLRPTGATIADMSLRDDATRIRGIAKHSPDYLDADDVRAFATRVLDHLEQLSELLDASTLEVDGLTLMRLLEWN